MTRRAALPFDPWAALREADRKARACGHRCASLLGCEACRAAGAARIALACELRAARDRGELAEALALLWEQAPEAQR